jgi:YidC/Oxa1 family membrane protein insertase
MTSFLNGPIAVAYHIVVSIAHVLTPITGGLATAVAIVAFTMAVRLLLAPLSLVAMRGQARIAAVQPRVQELRSRYARRPERLQQELAALYAQEGGGMLAGCLPLLLQLPFFSVMYRLFLSRTIDGRPNGLLSRELFDTPLGAHWLSGAGVFSGHGLVFLGLFALLALVAALSARLARSSVPPGAVGGGTAGDAKAPGSLTALTRLLPYSTVVIAAFVPLAAGLYLLTTTAWTVAERTLLRARAASPASPASPANHGGANYGGANHGATKHGATKHGPAVPRAGSAR